MKAVCLDLLERIVMSEHHLSPTTRTLELAQIEELNAHLSSARSGSQGSAGLPAAAILVRLSGEGPPEYPYVHAHFSTPGATDALLVIELHTDSLRRLSHLAGRHHRWGD